MRVPRWSGRRSIFITFLLVLVVGAGATWLGLQARERAESERIATLLGLEPGMTVADVGAGDGDYAIAMARRVGPTGRVYATEVSRSRLEDIRRAAARANLANVTVVEAGDEATGLPEGCCDAVYLRHVYHHLAEPVAILAGLKAALKPGGTLVIIDFEPWRGSSAPDGVPRTRSGHGIDRALVADELREGGFAVEAPRDWAGRDFVVVARRP